MSKLTTFQELRHKCAELYAPKDWTTNLWADFFGDCIKLHCLNNEDYNESVDEITKCYCCDKQLIDNTVEFQRTNGIIED